MSKKKGRAIKGVLTFHSETGTEGGYWAFQDEQFITPNTTRFYCTRCGLLWNKDKESEEDVFKKGEGFEVKYGGSHTPGGGAGHYCDRDAHEFKKISEESWSYDGLHILEDGDFLTIFSKDDSREIVWQGTIHLKQHQLFTEHASGMWIHADQEGVSREEWSKWFFAEHPAQLTVAE